MCGGEVARSIRRGYIRLYCTSCGATQRPNLPVIEMQPPPSAPPRQRSPFARAKLHCGPPVMAFDPGSIHAVDWALGLSPGTPVC